KTRSRSLLREALKAPNDPLPLKNPPVSVPTIVPVPVKAPAPSENPHTLTTQELRRPDERLRKSIEAFLLDQRSEHTRRAYGKDLKRLIQFLHSRSLDRGIESIDRSVLIAYKDSLLGEGLQHTTIDRHLATLRSFFQWLVDDGLIAKSPAQGVRFLNPRKVSSTVGFSDEEVRKILSLPNLHTRTGSLHYAVLMTLFFCGVRRSELCSLRTSSVGVERGSPFVRLRGKGNAERIIALQAPVWSALRHYLTISGKELGHDQPLFTPVRNNRTSERDKALDPSMIFYIVARYARLAGIANRVSPHSCRATAISNARDRHVPDRAIQEFAGWASPDMITRYDKRKTALTASAAHAIDYGLESS
ncbi:MAG: tyrosine-type recombinase/integrase, partial [Bdellovibrionota bacterium]